MLVRIEPRGGAIDGRIEWRDWAGRWAGDQRFPSVSADCARLVRAMGFALAVQIQFLAKDNAAAAANGEAPVDGGSLSEAPTPPPVARPPIAMLPSPAPPTVPSPPDVARSPRGGPAPTFAIGTGPAIGLGLSSAPILLGRLFGAVEWPHVSIELAAVASLPATTRRADGAGFSQQHLFGSAGACATVTRWSGCVLANAGEVRMAGENVDRSTSASVLMVEAGLRAGIKQRLGRHAYLGGHADGLINVTRWTGSLDQVPVWTAPRFAAALGIDAIVALP